MCRRIAPAVVTSAASGVARERCVTPRLKPARRLRQDENIKIRILAARPRDRPTDRGRGRASDMFGQTLPSTILRHRPPVTRP
jgi:hypothetical protein